MSSANPYLQGMTAAEEEKQISSNPYRKNRAEWRMWRAGFCAARERMTLKRAGDARVSANEAAQT